MELIAIPSLKLFAIIFATIFGSSACGSLISGLFSLRKVKAETYKTKAEVLKTQGEVVKIQAEAKKLNSEILVNIGKVYQDLLVEFDRRADNIKSDYSDRIEAIKEELENSERRRKNVCLKLMTVLDIVRKCPEAEKSKCPIQQEISDSVNWSCTDG